MPSLWVHKVSIVREMIPRDESDDNSAVLELRAGTVLQYFYPSLIFFVAAGGVESSLFTAEMLAMYQK